MRLKFIFVACLGFFTLLSNTTKPIADNNRVENIRESISSKVLKAANVLSELDDTEDPEEIFARAIDSYKTEFDSYINVIGLNVDDKSYVNIEGFDINYVAPSYSDVMYDYQIDFENSMSSTDLIGYENFRKTNYDLDWSVTLINNKFKDLNIATKYNHTDTGSIITTPVVNPGSGIGTGGTVKRAAATIAIGSILAGVGLGEAVISAFSACIASLQVALGSSWIPFVGWIIAVGIAVGALIALTVIIVQNWDAICSVIEDIKAYFLNAFSKFASLIETYFGDAEAQVEKSNSAGTQVIGGKTFEFEQVNSKDLARQIALVKSLRWTKNIYLMEYVNNKGFLICPIPVDLAFCINAYDVATNIRGTHNMGFSSYTWYQNVARQLILFAGSGVTTSVPEIDSNKGDPSILYMKHFHNCYIDSLGNVMRIDSQPQHRSHSFFGQLYYYPSSSSDPVVHPSSPNPKPNA